MKQRNWVFHLICLGAWLVLNWLCWLAADRSSGMVSLLKTADALTFACFVLFAAFWVGSVIVAAFRRAQGWLVFTGLLGVFSIAGGLCGLLLPLFQVKAGLFSFFISWLTAPYFGLTHAAQDVLRIGLITLAALIGTALPWLLWATIKPHRRSIYPEDEPEEAPAAPLPVGDCPVPESPAQPPEEAPVQAATQVPEQEA